MASKALVVFVKVRNDFYHFHGEGTFMGIQQHEGIY